jgi:uncharacterized membrane protein YiaA
MEFDMQLNERVLFTVLLFGLSAIGSKKSVWDRLEGLEVTDLYYGISWFSHYALVLIVGLWNADLLLSEKVLWNSLSLSLYALLPSKKKHTR